MFAANAIMDQGKLLRTLLVAIVVGVVAMIAQSTLTRPLIFAPVFVAALAILGIEIVALFRRTQRTFVPALSGLYSLFAVPATWRLERIAREMWSSTVAPGRVMEVESVTLAAIHFLFITIFAILTAILWFRFFCIVRHEVRVLAIASILFVVFSSISFYWTVPRSGNEGTMLWLLLVPAFFLTGIILLSTCISVLVIHHRRRYNR